MANIVYVFVYNQELLKAPVQLGTVEQRRKIFSLHRSEGILGSSVIKGFDKEIYM